MKPSRNSPLNMASETSPLTFEPHISHVRCKPRWASAHTLLQFRGKIACFLNEDSAIPKQTPPPPPPAPPRDIDFFDHQPEASGETSITSRRNRSRLAWRRLLTHHRDSFTQMSATGGPNSCWASLLKQIGGLEGPHVVTIRALFYDAERVNLASRT